MKLCDKSGKNSRISVFRCLENILKPMATDPFLKTEVQLSSCFSPSVYV